MWVTILRDEQFMDRMGPAEKWCWIGLLLLAGDSHYPGKICITDKMGYSPAQLAGLLKVTPQTIDNTIDLMGGDSVCRDENGVISIVQWEKYQSEWMRVSKYDRITTPKTTPETTRKKEKEKENKKESEIQKESKTYIPVFDLWNYHRIITHKRMTDKMKGKVSSLLAAGYTQEDVLTAIDNYAHILAGDGFYFSYKWSLDEFLQRGFEKFKDRSIAEENYRRKSNDINKDKPANITAEPGKYDGISTIR